MPSSHAFHAQLLRNSAHLIKRLFLHRDTGYQARLHRFKRLFARRIDAAAAGDLFALAKALKVRKFALVSDVPGLLRDPADPSTLLSTLRLSDVAHLKADGVIAGGMLPKIESCEEAIRAGVRKVHLVDGRMAHSLLLEIFTRQGVGTEITE
jgi:acetylglutamate kinase